MSTDHDQNQAHDHDQVQAQEQPPKPRRGRKRARSTTEPTDRWLSAKQVSDALGVNRATVINWARRGVIPAVQYGERGIYRFRESDVDAFLEGSRIQPRIADESSTNG